MGAPPTQYPIGQNQNAGAYAAQGWGAAAYQQWPGQPNDPCTFTFVGGSCYIFSSNGCHCAIFLQRKLIPMPLHGLHITSSSNFTNNPAVEHHQRKLEIQASQKLIAVALHT